MRKDEKQTAIPSRFNIQVTETDIAKAKKNDSYQCVVAQAIARAIPKATRIDVDIQAIRFTIGDRRLVFLTPYAVQGYIVAFDAGDPIEPFSFQLRNPQRTKQRQYTEAGRAAQNAARSARRTVAKKISASREVERAMAQPSEESREVERAAAKAAYEAARAENGNQVLFRTKPGRRAPARVFKRKTRSYGHRLLRINQQPSQPGA